MDFLQNHIEALIFCSPLPVKIEDLRSCLSEIHKIELPKKEIAVVIDTLTNKYSHDEYSFQIYKAGEGYQFLTKPSYQVSIGTMLKQQSKKRISTSALETLAIIAYKQPVSKTEVESIRGVNCDYSIQKLLEKGLIDIRGKGTSVGRPIIYGTSSKFMEYFGINNLNELPTLKDFSKEIDSIGEVPEN